MTFHQHKFAERERKRKVGPVGGNRAEGRERADRAVGQSGQTGQSGGRQTTEMGQFPVSLTVHEELNSHPIRIN